MRALVIVFAAACGGSPAQPAAPAPASAPAPTPAPVTAQPAAPASEQPAIPGGGDPADPNHGAYSSITGTGDISSGFDDTNIYGGLLGDEPGAGSGSTVKMGGPIDLGTRAGRPASGDKKGNSKIPRVTIGQPVVQGGELDKAIIRRYIKRNIMKIQYCYEKLLLVKPGISGTTTTTFTIGGDDGKVSNAKAKGFAGVDDCVTGVIAGIEFPKPKDKKAVDVTYPINFKPSWE